MVTAYLVLLALLGVERIFELWQSRQNAAWALARGGVERGRGHFRVMKVLHTGFFVACVAEVVLLERPFVAALGWPMLAVALAAQGLRYWAVTSLGPYWNVRVIVLPGAPVVTSGPYRFLRHPNYLAVVLEGIAVPMIHTGYLTALCFTILNGLLLAVRIRCEEAALAEYCDYEARFVARRRFWPNTAGGAS